MEIVQLNCCAVDEIVRLSDYKDDPKEAMKDFCEEIREQEFDYYSYHQNRYGPPIPGSFYIFTEVVRAKTKRLPTGYGAKFAKFIQDNNLGELSISVARANRVNHPDHIVRVYTWAPHKTNLISWWRKNRDRNEED